MDLTQQLTPRTEIDKPSIPNSFHNKENHVANFLIYEIRDRF